MKKLAPIVLFTYNRLFETQETLKALQKNYLAKESELFIFSDGPKNDIENKKISKIRSHFKGIEGFKNVSLILSKENKGLANSVIAGVTEIINQYDKIIVLEDDLITSPNFLDFMNQALDFYIDSPEIISISGYTLNLPSLHSYIPDYYLGRRASSWGWGTWKDKWQDVDWEVTDYAKFRKNYKKRAEFFRIGSDMPGMLKNQMNGKIDSWAIRLCYYQFRKNMKTVFASESKVRHIGTGKEATHAVGATRFDAPLDKGAIRSFEFEKNPLENEVLIREFRAKFSIIVRANAKFRRILGIN